jgi:glycerol uptake facilitator-like aquaporin
LYVHSLSSRFSIPNFLRHFMQYWLGPFLGSLLGASFYATLKQYDPLFIVSIFGH